MVVSSSSIRGLGIRGRRSDFHRAETGRHSFEAVIGEELVLEEAEESEEGRIGRDVGSIDEDKSVVCDEHLG